MIGLKHHIHCYSSELVKVTQVATYKILGVSTLFLIENYSLFTDIS